MAQTAPQPLPAASLLGRQPRGQLLAAEALWGSPLGPTVGCGTALRSEGVAAGAAQLCAASVVLF